MKIVSVLCAHSGAFPHPVPIIPCAIRLLRIFAYVYALFFHQLIIGVVKQHFCDCLQTYPLTVAPSDEHPIFYSFINAPSRIFFDPLALAARFAYETTPMDRRSGVGQGFGRNGFRIGICPEFREPAVCVFSVG
ncbi:hypothetical protein Tcan_01012, partial [Toxocara canis]